MKERVQRAPGIGSRLEQGCQEDIRNDSTHGESPIRAWTEDVRAGVEVKAIIDSGRDQSGLLLALLAISR